MKPYVYRLICSKNWFTKKYQPDILEVTKLFFAPDGRLLRSVSVSSGTIQNPEPTRDFFDISDNVCIVGTSI